VPDGAPPQQDAASGTAQTPTSSNDLVGLQPQPAYRVHEILQPDFLRTQLDRLQQSESPPLSEQEYAEATGELQERQESLLNRSALMARPDAVFFPHHPALNILQSTLETCLNMRRAEVLDEAPGPDPRGPKLGWWKMRPGVDLYRAFGPCDLRWIAVKVAEGIKLLHGKPPFPDRPADPVQIADDARLVIVGDWGTGLQGAVNVGREMRGQLEAAAGRDRHVIHLGDVYYSGWTEEYASHFLPYWPHLAGDTNVRSWALNGNHDMVSGGHGYFGHLMRDPRFAGQQGSSHFRLYNRYWQIVGLDTSYEDRDLAGTQVDWIMDEAIGSPARMMLLTHHQLFSAYGARPNSLGQRLAPVFAKRRIDAWFWGHEHRCAAYEPVEHVQAPRCIGHGGVPVIVPDPDAPVPDGVRYEYRGSSSVGAAQWGLFGFVVLDFEGPAITVRYINERGEEHYREVLT
jgi:hypothetical protein